MFGKESSEGKTDYFDGKLENKVCGKARGIFEKSAFHGHSTSSLSKFAVERGSERRAGPAGAGAQAQDAEREKGAGLYLVGWSVLGRQQGGRQQAQLGTGSKIHGKQTRQIKM